MDDVLGGRTPVILAYVRRYPAMTDGETCDLQLRLAAIARLHGRKLGAVHVEELPTEPQAFERLLASVQELPVPAVIVPSKAHLGRWDLAGSKYAVLQQAVQTEVIVANDGAYATSTAIKEGRPQ